MKSKVLVISIVLVLMFGLTACGAVSSLKSVNTTGDAFMQALKDQDNSTSWALLTQAVQDEIGGESALADFTQPRNFDSWKFSSTNIENNTAQLDGEAKISGDTYTVTLIMDPDGENWKISGINFTLK